MLLLIESAQVSENNVCILGYSLNCPLDKNQYDSMNIKSNAIVV